MAFTEQGAEQFHNRGRDIVTNLAAASDDFRAWARVFEIRGGRLAIDDASAEDDPELGLKTEAIVVFHNALIAFLDANDGIWQDVLDTHRADY